MKGDNRLRWLPIGAAVAVWVALLAVALFPEWRAAARARLPWMIEPLFHDWHIVRLGWEAHAAGVDPLADRNDPFNYPRFVLLAAELGRQVPPQLAALVGAALFLAALAWVLRPRSRGEALLAAALIVSPPVLLLVERGNLDAWAFGLLTVGLAAMARAGERSIIFCGGVAAAATAALIKLYPAVVLPAAVCFARGRRRQIALFGCAVVGAWWVLNLGEIGLIMEKTTRGYDAAYGRMVIGARYYAEVQARGDSPMGFFSGLLPIVTVGSCLAGFLTASILGVRKRERFAAVRATGAERSCFCAGALIYAGTFLLGNNWAYRLVFLALCVPWLWRATSFPVLRIWAWVCLAGIAVLLLAPFRLPLGWFLAQQVVAWTVAFTLTCGAVGLLSRALSACVDESAG